MSSTPVRCPFHIFPVAFRSLRDLWRPSARRGSLKLKLPERPLDGRLRGDGAACCSDGGGFKLDAGLAAKAQGAKEMTLYWAQCRTRDYQVTERRPVRWSLDREGGRRCAVTVTSYFWLRWCRRPAGDQC